MAGKIQRAANQIVLQSRKSVTGEQSRTLERVLQREALSAPAAINDESHLRAALEACEQLAIHFEHHARTLDRAMQVTRHGLTLVNLAEEIRRRNSFTFGETIWQKWEARLTRRLERLAAKNSRAIKKLGIELVTAQD